MPLKQYWGGCTVAAPATVPFCHDWTGVVSLSPHVFVYKYGEERAEEEGIKERKRRAKEEKKKEEKENRERKKKIE